MENAISVHVMRFVRLIHFVALAWMVACPGSTHASEGASAEFEHRDWDRVTIREAASARSGIANLLDQERRALGASLDRGNRQQCAQVGLMQAVLGALAIHQRSASAAEALVLVAQLEGLREQTLLLREAQAVTDDLRDMAQRADELGLQDGNPVQWQRRGLTLTDQLAQATAAAAKARIRLAELTGWSGRNHYGAPSQGIAMDDITAMPFSQVAADADPPIPTAEQARAIALDRRADLRAIGILCASLTGDSLPAGRQLLAAQQPGLGLTAALAVKPLLALHSSSDDADLCHRRDQCGTLRQIRSEQIEAEVERALIDLELAYQRHALAVTDDELSATLLSEREKAVELDKAPVGSDKLSRLERLESTGERIAREVDRQIAWIKLRETMGTVMEGNPESW